MRLKKIISGGQTGADRAGLEVAKELGFATGGMAPKGYRTENGPDLSLRDEFGLIEHASPEWLPRTRWNVANSDATLIFGERSSGSIATKKACNFYQKPCLWNPMAIDLAFWLGESGFETLNIAGNRASVNPKVGELVKRTMRAAFTIMNEQS